MLRPAVALAVVSVTSLACGACHHDEPPPNPSAAATASGPGSTATPLPAPADGQAGTTGDAAATEDVVVRIEDDGKSFDVARGAELTFELARHAGTGFEWSPAPMDGGVLVQRGERTSRRTSDVPGAEKDDVYRFVAQSAGTVSVEMQLRRPWGDQPPVKTLRVVVHVR